MLRDAAQAWPLGERFQFAERVCLTAASFVFDI